MLQDQPDQRRPRVLVVEDDPQQLSLLVDVLTRRGFDCIAAASVVEGVRALGQAGDTLDVVVTDYDLSDGFGDQLVAQAADRQLPALVVTGRRRASVPAELEVWCKPVQMAPFVERLRELARDGQPAPAAPAPAAVSGREAAPPAAVGASDASDAGGSDSEPETTHLILYVAGDTPSSRRARRVLREAERAQGEHVRVEVIDLLTDPDRVADGDRVVFTPTLVRRQPRPRIWIIGDLSDGVDWLLDELELT